MTQFNEKNNTVNNVAATLDSLEKEREFYVQTISDAKDALASVDHEIDDICDEYADTVE